MLEPNKVQRTALKITSWVGSPASIAIHTILFIVSFGLSLAGYIAFDRMLLAQARTEGMLLLTVDASVFQYQESVLAV